MQCTAAINRITGMGSMANLIRSGGLQVEDAINADRRHHAGVQLFRIDMDVPGLRTPGLGECDAADYRPHAIQVVRALTMGCDTSSKRPAAASPRPDRAPRAVGCIPLA